MIHTEMLWDSRAIIVRVSTDTGVPVRGRFILDFLDGEGAVWSPRVGVWARADELQRGSLGGEGDGLSRGGTGGSARGGGESGGGHATNDWG